MMTITAGIHFMARRVRKKTDLHFWSLRRFQYIKENYFFVCVCVHLMICITQWLKGYPNPTTRQLRELKGGMGGREEMKEATRCDEMRWVRIERELDDPTFEY